jgi:hypothetical protein
MPNIIPLWLQLIAGFAIGYIFFRPVCNFLKEITDDS